MDLKRLCTSLLLVLPIVSGYTLTIDDKSEYLTDPEMLLEVADGSSREGF